VTRRELLLAPLAAGGSPGFRLADVTAAAGLNFRHNNGAFGAKYLPETMGPGCAFLDYDNDGWLDILLINGQNFSGQPSMRSTPQLYRNNRDGTFRDVTREAGLDIPMYGMGVAVGDFDNDGYPDLYITAVGQNRLLRNNRRGGFLDVTSAAGLGGRSSFSTSALWFDFDRDGLLDLFVCNYVRWSREADVHCSLDGKSKSYCTPEAYRGTTCWLFRNLGNGRFEDVTAKSGIFDASSKSLGVALLDFDRDGWPDVFVANDTQPNKLYRNNRDGTFREVAVSLGVAFSEDGRARAGMGVDTGDFTGSGSMGIAVTNFENERMAIYEWTGHLFSDRADRAGVGGASQASLGFGCVFLDADLDGRLDLLAVNGHIDDSVRNLQRKTNHAQPPHLFLNTGNGSFRDVAKEAGREFATPKVARGVAYGDFDRDGDCDVLLTTNAGPAFLYRNDVTNSNQSIRFQLEGRKSNRDAIGAVVRVSTSAGSQTAMVKSGSSYLSASEKALTFGTGKATSVASVTVSWPSGRSEEHKNLATGRTYRLVEGDLPKPLDYR
jgi:hypothetical protein